MVNILSKLRGILSAVKCC